MSGAIKPYGDTLGDGKVQLSFTLPIEWSESADEAARQLVVKMGFSDVAVAEGRRIANGFSFFVVYASTPVTVDASLIGAPSAAHAMSMEEIDALVRFTKENAIDAILASQVVTQKGSDIANFTALGELLEAEGLRDDVLLIAGGPRVTNLLATELGYDAGFGRNTLPSDVAAFIAQRLAERVPA